MHSPRIAMPRQSDGGWSHDQAAGLRRLLVPRQAMTVAFFGARAGAGTTTITTRCALTLSQTERSVLMLDERGGATGMAAALALASRFDLLQVMQGHVALDQAKLQVSEGLGLLSAARAIHADAMSDTLRPATWAGAIDAIRRSAAVVIVDAQACAEQALSPLAVAADRLVVVVGRGPAAVTESYALIKRLAYACQSRRVGIVAGKTRSREEAFAVFENLRRVAARHLELNLELLGHMPFDPQWRARRGRDMLAQDCAAAHACDQVAEALRVDAREAHAVQATSIDVTRHTALPRPATSPCGAARAREFANDLEATG